MFQNVAV